MDQEGVWESDPQYIEASEIQTKLEGRFYQACRETFTILYYPAKNGFVPVDLDPKYVANDYKGEEQVLAALKECHKYTTEIAADGNFRNRVESKLWPENAKEVAWSAIRQRAASDPSWIWHHPDALDSLKDELVKRDIWRETMGYITRGPFEKPTTSVQIQVLSCDHETGQATLRIRPQNGDTVYMETKGAAMWTGPIAGPWTDQLDTATVCRATGDRDDKFADVLVTTVQHLAVGKKYEHYSPQHFQLLFLDECHRSYYGDWHGVLEHFAESGAIRIGLTATPSDKETQNTDRYFCDEGQYQGPIFRYSIRQGEQDGILSQCHHFKFHTNVALHGVHDMGFDFEPDQLGRAVDVPQRNTLIAEKYFEVSGRRDPVKTIVFAASIRHAVNLRYALIKRYNELHHLPPHEATAEDFIVAIHNELKDARDKIEEFQRIGGDIRIAVGVGMLDTGIDAPDVEAILMARPTKSKILYVQMKGRGTRKCRETGKDFYKLVDFVDITRLEEGGEIVTNETPGVTEAPIEQEEEIIIDLERGGGVGGEPPTGGKDEPEPPELQEMIILDVPVTLESSEVLAPAMLEDLRRQIESQLRKVLSRDGLREHFVQTVYSWRYFKGRAPIDHSFIATMGFDVRTLRDLYGEPEADIEDFVSVALGEADFDLVRRRRLFERWALDKNMNREQRELIQMLCDFRHANPNLTPEQLLRSQWLDGQGGVSRIKSLFGSLKAMLALADDAMRVLNPPEEDTSDA